MSKRLFDFSALFPNWQEPVTRLPKGTTTIDYSNGGQPLNTPGVPEEIMAIVANLSGEDLRTDAGGLYMRQDKKIYVRIPHALNIDDRIIHRGTTYRVMSGSDYTDHADFGRYIMRHAAAGEVDPYA